MNEKIDPLILQFPVTTLDGRELLPKGTKISNGVLDRLIEQNHSDPFPVKPVLEHGTVRHDIIHFLTIPPYDTIFAHDHMVDYVIDLFDKVILPVPLLEILDYFKEQDFHTYRHSIMVYAMSTMLAKVLGGDFQEVLKESIAGPTHDFGKINVPLEILKKPTPLTNAEDRRIKHHVLAGYVLLAYYLGNRQEITSRLARDHHERRDGSGYLRGIKQKIRLVEIVTVADIYDALIAHRPYRKAPYDNRSALDELVSMAENGKIGWAITKALIAMNRHDKPSHHELVMSTEKRGKAPTDNAYGKRKKTT